MKKKIKVSTNRKKNLSINRNMGIETGWKGYDWPISKDTDDQWCSNTKKKKKKKKEKKKKGGSSKQFKKAVNCFKIFKQF